MTTDTRIAPAARPPRLTFLALFAAVVLLLPFWGYAVIPLGTRGIQLNWLLALGAAALFVAQFLLGKSVVRDSTGTLLVVAIFAAIIASVYQPLARGQIGMLSAWTTTFAQYAIGLGLILVVINLRPSAALAHKLFDCHVLLAAGIGLFGVAQLIGSSVGLDLNLNYLNPGMRDAISSYAERTGGLARATGLFEEPRQLGAYLAGSLALAMGLLTFTPLDPRRRRRLTLAVPVLIAGLLSTLSASAFITAGVLLSVLLLLSPQRRSGLGRWLPLLVLGVVGISVYLFAAYSDHVLAVFLQSKLSPPDLRVAWAQIVYLDQGQWGWFRYLGSFGIAVRTWAVSPIVGVGLNNLEFYSVSLLASDFTGAFGPVRLLAETGLLGVTSISVFLGYLVLRLRRGGREVRLAGQEQMRGLAELGCLVVASVLLRSLATNLYGFPSIFFWAELGFAVLALTVVRQNRSLPAGPSRR